MPLNGDINTFSLSAIVGLIHSENKTGTLKITSAGLAVSLYFTHGKIAFLSCDFTEDLSLSSLLKSRRIIGEDDIRKIVEISGKTGKRIETLLIEEGYLTQNKLTNLLRQQFKEVMATVITRGQGEYTYADDLSGYSDDLNLEIDPVRLMTEAQMWKEYRTLIPDDEVVFQISTGGFKPDPFTGDIASRVILLIDGQRSVARIIAETGLSRLAIYRAIMGLASQGAIIRKERRSASGGTNRKEDAAVATFYVNILHKMTAALAIEIGSQKAAFLVDKSLKRTPYYDLFLYTFHPNADVSTNSNRINQQLRRISQNFSRKNIINVFNLAIVNLLQEEYQLLGLTPTQNTAGQVAAGLELVSENQKALARNLDKILKLCRHDEDLLRGTKSLSEVVNFDKPQPSSQKTQSPPYRAGATGGTTIIAFYGKALQLVAGDLESEIGAKAWVLVQNIFTSSEYYEVFLSQFDIKADIRTNTQRIREHFGTKGVSLGGQVMITAFQHVLLKLLQEEFRLLGNKAARKSLLKLKEYMIAPQHKTHASLTDNLVDFLKKNSMWVEDNGNVFTEMS